MDEERREEETPEVEGHALGLDDADEDESRRRRLNEEPDEGEGDPGRRRR